MDRALDLDHAAELALGSGVGRALRGLLRAHVALDHIQVLDEQALLGGIHAQHAAGLAAILSGHHLDLIAGTDLQRTTLGFGCCAGALSHGYSTSGARDTIFMKLRSRSSRATGPNTRVPRGLFWSSMITAAFSSNAMYVPSSRPIGFLVRTTTAVTTSPFFTAPWGLACLTVAVITSPTCA